MRYFNTEGLCRPNEHYMVRLDDRLEKIKKLYVDRKKYFVINRGRQYGKTTTLRAMAEYLKDDYTVVSLDFQRIGTEDFISVEKFVCAFAKEFLDAVAVEGKEELLKPLAEFADSKMTPNLRELFARLSRICADADRPIVLMIDEVDSASNNQVFVDFLAQLRGYYLNRENSPIFHSVILAGVYDIKNLKLKIRPDAEHQYNSPWNTREDNEENVCLHTFDECTWDHKELAPYDIAARFNVDMSFSVDRIAVMLGEYEADNQTGMDVEAVAQEIYQYTSGYPYLVSAICKYLDEEIPEKKGFENIANVWTRKGISEAVKILLNESTPLFGSMMRHIDEYPDLKKMLYAMLFQGERVAYNPDNKTIELARMFGYVVNNNGSVRVANRIFETRLYNFFLSEEELSSAMSKVAKQDESQFVLSGRLNMEKVLEKFVEYFNDIYSESDEKFVENYGRKFFLLYLKPIINGIGNYYIEAQTRDARRTDVIVDYVGEQFIVEMKIWHGDEYHERGERQLAEYLDYYHQNKGYMLSFNFNKKKETGIKTIALGDKIIVEAVV